MRALDWSAHAVAGPGYAKRCRICDRWALLVDELGRPCHKVCAELEQIEVIPDLFSPTRESGESVGT
jgi:hypothetical protein